VPPSSALDLLVALLRKTAAQYEPQGSFVPCICMLQTVMKSFQCRSANHGHNLCFGAGLVHCLGSYNQLYLRRPGHHARGKSPCASEVARLWSSWDGGRLFRGEGESSALVDYVNNSAQKQRLTVMLESEFWQCVCVLRICRWHKDALLLAILYPSALTACNKCLAREGQSYQEARPQMTSAFSRRAIDVNKHPYAKPPCHYLPWI